MARSWQESRRALGSEATLHIVCESQDEAQQLLQKLWRDIDAFEARFSRFLPDSELSTLNQNAGKKVTCSTEMIAVLVAVTAAVTLSDGAYNPFILPALQAAGYGGSWTAKHTPAAPKNIDFSNRRVASADELEIGEDWVRIPADSALDLGGIGKGYLLDQLANSLPANMSYWLSLGGDIVMNGQDEHGASWDVEIPSALEADETLATTTLTIGEPRIAIATSGVIKRRGYHNNAAWHHLIDPTTLKPSDTDVLTSTVVAHSALVADILAKCSVLAGSADAVLYLRKKYVRGGLVQALSPRGAAIFDHFGIVTMNRKEVPA